MSFCPLGLYDPWVSSSFCTPRLLKARGRKRKGVVYFRAPVLETLAVFPPKEVGRGSRGGRWIVRPALQLRESIRALVESSIGSSHSVRVLLVDESRAKGHLALRLIAMGMRQERRYSVHSSSLSVLVSRKGKGEVKNIRERLVWNRTRRGRREEKGKERGFGEGRLTPFTSFGHHCGDDFGRAVCARACVRGK